MTKEQPKTGLDLLRTPFPANQISKLPKPTKAQTDAVKANFNSDDPFPGSSAGQLAALRCAFILLYAGVEDVRVLNGGLQAWLDASAALAGRVDRAGKGSGQLIGRPGLMGRAHGEKQRLTMLPAT